MRKIALLLLVVGLWGLSEADAQAQFGYVTYYQPAVYQPTVAYYQPAPVAYQPAPVVYQPAPVAYTSYYPAPAVVAAPAYQPVTRVRTRYRPILGGTVTRYRTFYRRAPLVYAY